MTFGPPCTYSSLISIYNFIMHQIGWQKLHLVKKMCFTCLIFFNREFSQKKIETKWILRYNVIQWHFVCIYLEISYIGLYLANSRHVCKNSKKCTLFHMSIKAPLFNIRILLTFKIKVTKCSFTIHGSSPLFQLWE